MHANSMPQRSLTISKSSIWQFLMYVVMIGFTVIAYKKTDLTYLFARAIQGVQVLFLGYLLLSTLRQGKLRVSKYDLMVHLWWIIWLAITFYNQSEVWLTTIFNWMNVTIFLLIGQKYWREDPQHSLKLLASVFSCLVYLNVVLLILYPDGLWIDTTWVGTGDSTRYLFGNYNAMGVVCLCALIVQSAYTFLSHRGYGNLFGLILVSLFTVIFVGSMTSTVGLSLIVLYIIFHKQIKHPFVFIIAFFCIYIVFIVLIVFMGNSIEDYPAALQFVENVLGKEASFTTRTGIWIETIDLIMQRPWIGYGYQSVEWNAQQIGASGPHNLWLEIMMYGGIVAVGGFILLIFKSTSSVYHSNSYATIVVGVGLCVLLLMSLFETYSMILIFLVIQMTYYTTYFPQSSTGKLC